MWGKKTRELQETVHHLVDRMGTVEYRIKSLQQHDHYHHQPTNELKEVKADRWGIYAFIIAMISFIFTAVAMMGFHF